MEGRLGVERRVNMQIVTEWRSGYADSDDRVGAL